MNTPTSHSSTLTSYESVVRPLPRIYRRIIFILGCVLFVVAVPLFILYAMGYRFDPFATENGITATGGLYIGIVENEGNIYLRDQAVRGSRIFLNGVYLQNIEPGVQQVHVQLPGLQTWVKDLPVFPHMVTETRAFLLPEQPQIRVVTPTLNAQSVAVLPVDFTATTSLAAAIANNQYIEYSEPSDENIYQANPEYESLENLFATLVQATSTGDRTEDAAGKSFSFGVLPSSATTTIATSTSIATTTKEQDGIQISLREGELFGQYVGAARLVPEYFCVPNYALASTTELYGAQVAFGIEYARKLHIFPQPPQQEAMVTTNLEGKVCRHEIRLDTKRQTVYSFYFLPTTKDFVVMHLEDGVYVVELDDRSWQNVQTLFSGAVDGLLVDNNRIFIMVDGVFLELYTTLHSI